MNDLIRPTLYDAWHDILPVTEAGERPRQRVDVVGPVCESGDYMPATVRCPGWRRASSSPS